MKKTLAIIIFIIMFMAVSTFSLAAGTNGTITVNNPVNGQTYSAYKLFDLNMDADNGSYTYTIDSTSPWYNFVNTGNGKNYVTLTQKGDTNTYYVTWKDGQSEEQFAKDALAYAKANTIDVAKSATAGETDTTLVLDNLELGYYLVDSSLGALCALTTTKPNATVQEKNTTPTVEKTVKEGETYGKTNDAELGAEVEFKTVINAKKGAENYVLHDKMNGLSLVANSIAVNDGSALVANTHYTVDTDPDDECTFEIVFKPEYLNTITADKTITVTYKGTVNADAVIAGEGNSNQTWLKYGDTNNTDNKTVVDETKTYVWNFNIFKFTKNGETDAPLQGAKFVLKNAEGKYAKVVGGKLTGWVTNKAEAELTTDNNGNIAIAGLDSGNYKLEETVAPEGYNLLADDVDVVIAADGKVNDTTDKIVRVENQKGALLPETGGIGTKIFYIVGGVLFVGAVIFIIVRKRMNSEE